MQRVDLLPIAKSLLGYFTYGTDDERTDWDDWEHPKKDGHADCSSFVWLVMKHAGCKVGDEPFSTPEMEQDAKGDHEFFKEVTAADSQAGDAIIINIGVGYGPDGHTGILLEPYHGPATKIIEMGGDDHGSVHIANVQDSFGDKMLSEGRMTLAQPLK